MKTSEEQDLIYDTAKQIKDLRGYGTLLIAHENVAFKNGIRIMISPKHFMLLPKEEALELAKAIQEIYS